jgi:hypothetical protein
MVGHGTGLSSRQIVATMHGVAGQGHHPADPSDLGRCIRLLEIMPEWKPRMKEMGLVSLEWRVLAEHWDELEALYNEEFATGRAPKTYDRMRELLKPIEDARTEAWMQARQKAKAGS